MRHSKLITFEEIMSKPPEDTCSICGEWARAGGYTFFPRRDDGWTDAMVCWSCLDSIFAVFG